MKFLKRLLIAIASLLGVYLILALFGPKEYTVERSRVMQAPKDAVWQQISSFQNWPNWSPWQEKDPSVENQFKGEKETVGSMMSWVGDPDLSGTGSMEITKLSREENIYYKLKFEVPFEMESDGGFELTEDGDQVKVSWYDHGNIPFLMRPMMMFMDLDSQIGPDFERGLEKLDSVASLSKMDNSLPPNSNISEVDFPAKDFVGIRHKISMAEAMKSEFYAENFGKLGQLLGEKQVDMAGMPVTIVYSWNEQDSTTEMVPAFPIMNTDFEPGEGFEMIHMEGRRAVLGKHFGSYESTGEMHVAIEKYLNENGLKSDLVIEEYANDPQEVAPEEVLTNIYYLIVE